MVSIDHFGYELRRQLHEAAAKSASELLITSHDLCRSVRSGTAWLNACCEAMEQEGIGQMREGIAEFLELTEAESRQLRLRHIKQIAAAIGEAQKLPNG